MSAAAAGQTAPLSRTAEGMAAWRRRSQRVHWLRRWLPRVMIALAVFTFMWMLVRGIVAIVIASDYQSGEVHMINPKFLGRDEKGRPYAVTAADAVRDPRRPDRVRLTGPVIAMQNPDAQPMVARARTGFLDQTVHTLVLSGDVIADDGKGATFRSQHAVIDTDGGAVRGDSAVEGVGPLGRITASSYSISPHGDHIVFTGGVHSHVIVHQQSSSKETSLRPRL